MSKKDTSWEKEFDKRYPKPIYAMVKDLLGHGDIIGNVDQRVQIKNSIKKVETDAVREERGKIMANLVGLFPINILKKWTSKEVLEHIVSFFKSNLKEEG